MDACRNVSLPAVFLEALLLAFAGSARAGLDEWTTVGPPNGVILSLAINPDDPSILFAGTQSDGVFKSLDGGTSWRAASAGLPDFAFVHALALEPGNPSTVYAGTGPSSSSDRRGAFRSLDGATSWTRVDDGLPDSAVTALVIDPASSSTLYAVSNAELYKSTDGAASWTQLSNGLNQADVEALVIDPVNPSTLYAGAFELFKSTDGGATWTQLKSPGSIRLLAIAPRNPKILLAASGALAPEVWKSIDGGTTWSDVSAGLPLHGSVLALAIDPVDPSTFYVGTSGRALSKSVDGGASWVHADEGLTELNVNALAIDPADPSILYAGADLSGVFKSTDGGVSWKGVHAGLPGASVGKGMAIAAGNPSTIYASARGIFRNTGNTSWTDLSTSGSRRSSSTLVVDPSQPSNIFAGFGNNRGGVSKSIDGAISWVEVVHFDGAFTLAMAIDPVNGSTLYASTLGDDTVSVSSGVYKGIDGGTSWSQVSGIDHANVLAIDFQDPSTVYAGLESVFKSVDDGATWSDVGNGLPEGESITDLAIDPKTPTTVYAISLRSGPGRAAAGLFKTVDGGGSWNAVDNGLPEFTQVTSVVIDPNRTSTIYSTTAGTPGRVFKSVDAGAFWTELEAAPIPALTVARLAIDPENPSTLYAATSAGVFNLTQADCESPTTLCLKRGRFVVDADWRNFAGVSGSARVVAHRSGDSGLLWFFGADNWEMLVKTLDGCRINGHFWVFAAAATNVEYTLRVTDTLTGGTKKYSNPRGNTAAAVTDTRAFYACEE